MCLFLSMHWVGRAWVFGSDLQISVSSTGAAPKGAVTLQEPGLVMKLCRWQKVRKRING